MTQPTTHRATRENGPSVINGQLIWTSATGITTADPNSFGGCTRKWWYDYVAGEKAPATKAMLGGTELHTEVENHLRFGASLQTPLALSGGIFIPQPGSGLQIERPIHFTTANGVGIYGHVDLYNFRQEYIDSEGELQRDPPWSFEVKDWKTTSDFKYAKTERELKENIQLITYAEAGFRFAPDMEHARLTHVSFRTRGAPASKLVTVRRTREEVASRWQYSESIVRVMADAAREPTAETVPGLRKACDAYNGCPHRAKCNIYRFDALEAVYGKVAEDHANNSTGWGVEPPQPNQENATMGLISSNPQMMNQQPAQQPAQPDMRQQLADEEARQRQQSAQQQQQMPQQFDPHGFQQACLRLQGYGYGFPTLGGNAAQAYAAVGGQSIAPGVTYPGQPALAGARRSLHGIQLTEVAHIYQLDSELAKELAAAQPAPPPVMMQQAPLAPQMQTMQYTPNPQALGFLPPDAPQSMPQLAMQGGPQQNTGAGGGGAGAWEVQTVHHTGPINTTQPGYNGVANLGAVQPAQDAVLSPVDAPAPKPKGRPKKVQDAAPGPIAASVQGVPPSSPPATATQVAPAATSAIPSGLESGVAIRERLNASRSVILVNARAAGSQTTSLAPYVDYINAELSKRYCVGADGRPSVQDVRCAPKDSPLAFGGWKGAVREVVKADPPSPGDYHLDTFMDELNEAVADALRVVADQSGWLYVRAVRG